MADRDSVFYQIGRALAEAEERSQAQRERRTGADLEGDQSSQAAESGRRSTRT